MSTIAKALARGRKAMANLSRRRTERRLARLRHEVHDPDYHLHVVPARKAIYVEVPKAACSSIKHLLSESLNGPIKVDEIHNRARSGIPGIAQVGAEAFFGLADHPETLIFTFVRNPYTRLVSCYREKFQRYPMGKRIPFNRDLQAYFGRRLQDMDPDQPLSFRSFIEMACATSRTGQNGHWLAMDRLVPKDDVACRFIGRLERFDADIEIVCERLNVQPHGRKYNATGAVRLSDWIEPDIKDAIRSAYREDFERFEYSTALSD